VSTWRRWLRYGKAKLDDTVDGLNRTLDRKERDLDTEQSGKPWLADDEPAPSFDQAKARLEDATKDVPRGGAASGDPTFDLATQQREADARLAEIRKSLGVDDPPPRP
jgi:hypothetical protein